MVSTTKWNDLAQVLDGLVDVGGNERTPWAVQAGAGLGVVRIYTWKWRLKDNQPQFQVDNPTQFAWQAQLGVRRRLTNRIDLTLKYRFFNVPNLKYFTANANRLDAALTSHSLVLGANFNF